MAGWIAAGGLCVGLMACCCVADESKMRTWSDASGKFSVRATLKEKTDTAVSLITADGRMVEVPITRLSDGDKAYLASLDMPTDDPFAGGVPLEGMTDLVPQVNQEDGAFTAGKAAGNLILKVDVAWGVNQVELIELWSASSPIDPPGKISGCTT